MFRWISACLFILDLSGLDFPHWMHWYLPSSPLRIMESTTAFSSKIYDFRTGILLSLSSPYFMVQGETTMPLCSFVQCLAREFLVLKTLQQTMHWCETPKWVSACRSALCLVSNCFPQFRHSYFPRPFLPTMFLTASLISKISWIRNIWLQQWVDSKRHLFHGPRGSNLSTMVFGVVCCQTISTIEHFVTNYARIWNAQMAFCMSLHALLRIKLFPAVEALVFPELIPCNHGLDHSIDI